VRDFSVYEEVGAAQVIGCGALQICWEDLAEIRSLAVHPDFERRRIGTKLMEAVINEARSLNVKKIFTLTYEPDFFSRFDFHVIDRADLPLKIWADCIICVKFPDCDETAMMKDLQ
jgi:amino-acid N-acetyltransferase